MQRFGSSCVRCCFFWSQGRWRGWQLDLLSEMRDRWDAGAGSAKLAGGRAEAFSAVGDGQVSPGVLQVLMKPFVLPQDRQWRYARRFLGVSLSSWGTALLFESESYKIPSRMALVDKHKVKRQRLDRICEGKSVLQFFRKCW